MKTNNSELTRAENPFPPSRMGWFYLMLVSLALCPFVNAADIHVSPSGSDSHPGTASAPLRSLAAARDAARSLAGREAVTVWVADGVYYLPETLVFTPADSGSPQHPVTYRTRHEGQAVLSGGAKLELTWRPHGNGILKASTPAGLAIDQLFINGQNQRMARYPNYDKNKPTAAYQGYAADAFSRERAAQWKDPTGGYIHAMHRARWGGYHYRITGKDAQGDVTYEGGWQNNRQMGMHKDFRMVENIFEELDAPGEWYHQASTRTLYYMPEPGVDMGEARVEVVRLRHLIEFQGSLESPVRFITLQGFVVRHAARTFMDTREPLLRSDWAIYRGGAFMLTGTEDIRILDTEFDQVGGNAIFVNHYNRRTQIRGCHIHDTGGSGICFVGDPDAVRDPLFEYGQKNDLSMIDRTPGPRTENYPALGVVADCLIHGIGRVERQPAGVQIAMSRGLTIRDTSVYDCARAGINIGDGCWGGHLIERCDVFDTVLETHDHGSFNSWGRDRYWRSDHLTASQAAVDQEPTLPFLDAMETTVIRDSRWRCDHGWDIDLDDGSSNYDIYNNLLLHGGLKFREGFRRRAWNNIMVNNSFHPHVWYANSGDEFFGNIVMTEVKGIRAPTNLATGKNVDKNLFFVADPRVKDKYAEQGWDLNSIAADPLFVDPAHGDFRVEDGSPALQLGFRNFPMDRFGVKKPALKAVARTPIIPEPGRSDQQPSPPALAQAAYWLGAKLRGLQGQEFSAFGVGKEDGGVVLVNVSENTAAADAGFKPNDLVQGLNGHKVSNIADLLTAYIQAGEAPLTVQRVRDQKSKWVTLMTAPYIRFESAPSEQDFAVLPVPDPSTRGVSANQGTHNDPLHVLVDGKLAKGYGPVFGNGTDSGAYKMDLGQAQPVTAITSWSFNQNGNRGPQRVTLFAGVSDADPGWNTADRARFTPLGTMDTTAIEADQFNAVSLRARKQGALGTFRWIVWRVAPVTTRGENTAFQELHVAFGKQNMSDYRPETGSELERTKGPWAITPDPDLPNVLILGDSISIGYTLSVRKLLQGKANVFRPHTANGARPQNCQGTTLGVREIDRWLAGRRWDVIHFNWGLHDLKHVDAVTGRNSQSFDDPRQAEPEVYRKQLTAIVSRLKATGAKLIFSTTTPFPDGVKPARLPADARLYNEIALDIMRIHRIEVNDLFTLCASRLEELQQPKNVHFNGKGSQVLAEQVAKAIANTLPSTIQGFTTPEPVTHPTQ
jgi:hypothetical protein